MRTILTQSCKKHLTLKPFNLKHEPSTDFIISQWQCDRTSPTIAYGFYRISMFVIFFVSWIFTYLKESPAGKPRWPIYLTNWGFTLCLIQSLLCSVMVVGSLLGDRLASKNSFKEKVLKLYRVYWITNVTATPVAFTISIIYWSLIFKAEGANFTAMNFIVHGLNSIVVLLDLCIVCHPVKIFHFIYPLLLALCYTIFSITFYVAGGTTKTGSRYIYPILKWDQPGRTTGICAGVMVLMIFLHLFTFLLYKLRMRLYMRFVCPKIDLSCPLSEKEQNESPRSNADEALGNDYV
ncbi:protein rolling stone-like [Euwallacea fornicatus]|uniref:protein rolling stone-like n=1 Tax=Euwallacea fornicatus TaxID=995702 RepID=UPI00338D358A